MSFEENKIQKLDYAKKKQQELIDRIASMDPLELESYMGETRMILENLLKRVSMKRDQWEVFNMMVGKFRVTFDVYVPRARV